MAAVVFSSPSTGNSSGSTDNFAVSGGSGKTLLAVMMYLYDGPVTLSADNATLSWNGTPMTLIHSRGWDNVNEYQLLSVFKLDNPTGATASFSWGTNDDADSPVAHRGLVIIAFEFDDLDQTDPVIAETYSLWNSTVTAPATVSGSRLMAFVQDNYSSADRTPFTPEADNTELFDGDTNGGTPNGYNSIVYFVGDSGPTDGSSSYDMGGTQTAGEFPQIVVLELRPATGGGSPQTITGADHSGADSLGAGVLAASYAIAGAVVSAAATVGAGALVAGYVIGGAAHTLADTFGAGDVQPGAAMVAGAAFGSADTFGAGDVSLEGAPQSVTGAVWSTADTVTNGAIEAHNMLDGAALSGADAFGAGTLVGLYAIAGETHVGADAFGTGDVVQGTAVQTIVGGAWSSPEAFGDGIVAATYAIEGAVVPAPASVGAGTITESYALDGVAFITTDTFGSGLVQPGAFVIGGATFASADWFGAGAVASGSADPAHAVTTELIWGGSAVALNWAVPATAIDFVSAATILDWGEDT